MKILGTYRGVSKVAGLFALLIAVLALLGWATGNLVLASLRSVYIPMAPNTAVCFVLLTVPVLLRPRLRWLVAPVFLLALLTLTQFLFHVEFGVDSWVVRVPGKFGEVALGAMSPITAGLFLMLSVSAFAPGRFVTLSVLGFAVSWVILLGYAYGNPLLYGGGTIPVALSTSCAFFFLSVALLAETKFERGPLRIFSEDTLAAQLLKHFLPVVLISILVNGFAVRWAGSIPFGHPALTTGIVTFAATLAAILVVARVAQRIGNRIGRLQAELVQLHKLDGIGRLAGGIAHDFNNLLAVVLNTSEFLTNSMNPGDPKLAEVREIQGAVERGRALTRQLLIFSRKEITQPKVVSINRLVADMEALLKRGIGEDVVLRTSLAADLWETEIDPSQFEMVLMNLAVNARDAMPRGGHLAIETSNLVLDAHYAKDHLGTEPGKYVLLSVSDTGCGMSREVREKIFEPFFTTKPRDKGTGLGLATAYGVVKQARGNIWVYSEVGAGTTFKIYLPAAKPREAAAVAEAPTPLKMVGHESILVVDDEASVRRAVRRILEQVGFTVREAGTAQEAMNQLKEGSEIDLVLTDLVMPEKSGRELAEEIRGLYPGLPVVFMSGYAGDVVTYHGLAKQDIPFIQKPFTRQQLIEMIRKSLEVPAPR